MYEDLRVALSWSLFSTSPHQVYVSACGFRPPKTSLPEELKSHKSALGHWGQRSEQARRLEKQAEEWRCEALATKDLGACWEKADRAGPGLATVCGHFRTQDRNLRFQSLDFKQTTFVSHLRPLGPSTNLVFIQTLG